jgi:magnesium transporter
MPGTLVPHPEANVSQVHVVQYGPTEMHERDVESVAHIPTATPKMPVVWINVDGLSNVALLNQLAARYELHPLAMEDVVNVHQRPKVEFYDKFLFLVARMARLGEGQLEAEQVSIFLREGLIITFQERRGDCLDQVRSRLRAEDTRVRQFGADYLMYSILDAIIDHYFPVVDRYADRLDEIEERIAGHESRGINAQLHHLRNELLLLRRALRPHREMLAELARDESSRISDHTRIFLRDCYDHTIQLLDLLDTYREMCSDLRDFHLSIVSNRMNGIMKVLTIISTIFIPLSFIAGVYGMNFQNNSPWNMPELSWRYGYPAVWGVMISMALVMIVIFWRKGWFSSS